MLTLNLAIRKQDLFGLKSLLEAGRSPDGTPPHDSAPMKWAIDTGQLAMVRTLLDFGASPDKHNALSHACTCPGSNMSIVKELLSRGANPDGFELRGGHMRPASIPLLQNMVIAGKTEIVSLLIEYGASTKKCQLSTIFKTPYPGEQKRRAQIACVKQLLAQCPPLSPAQQTLYKEFIDPWTTKLIFSNKAESGAALFRAIGDGDIDAVDYLVAQGADVHHKSVSGSALHLAASKDHTAVIDRLITYGADVHAIADFGITALHTAARHGHVTTINCLVRHGANVHAMSKLGTPLHVAAEQGQIDAIDNLIAHGANVDAIYEEGTPLHSAVGTWKEEVIDCLIRHGADARAKNSRGQTPAMKARRLISFMALPHGPDKIQVAEKLEDLDGTGEIRRKEEAKAKFINAARTGDITAIDQALLSGIDVNTTNSGGYTALHMAASNGHTSAIDFLVSHGANINAKINDREFVLFMALRHTAAIDCLVKHGVDINAKGADGTTALHLAARDGLLTSIDCLVKHGADIHAKTRDGKTPAMFAKARHDSKVIAKLNAYEKQYPQLPKVATAVISATARPSQHKQATHPKPSQVKVSVSAKRSTQAKPPSTKPTKSTPKLTSISPSAKSKSTTSPSQSEPQKALFQAAKTGNVVAIEQAILHGANVNARNDGHAAIHLAARAGHTHAIDCLVKHKADLHIKTYEGNTPLHSAVYHSHLAAIDCLVQHGADVHAKNKHGKTPGMVAKEYKKVAAAAKLQAYEKQYPPGPRLLMTADISLPTSSPSSVSPIPTTSTSGFWSGTKPLPLTPESSLLPATNDRAITLYPYAATTKEELSFSQGQVLTILEKQSSGWWLCESNGETGLVPSNFLEALPLPQAHRESVSLDTFKP